MRLPKLNVLWGQVALSPFVKVLEITLATNKILILTVVDVTVIFHIL
jgi:hypothetical protein